MVRVLFDPSNVHIYETIYQTGNGPYFQGFQYQRGYGMRGGGIGSIFRTMLRYIMPIAKTVGKDVGKEALISSARILDNIAQGAELKETILNESKAGLKRAAKRIGQHGSGAPKAKRRKTSCTIPITVVYWESHFL